MGHKIVVGTDFRAQAYHAIDRGLKLTERRNAEIVLVYALHPALSEPPPRSELDRRMRSVLPETEWEISFRHPIERADYAIAGVAREVDASLIVLGVARFNSMKDYLLGTAVDYVIRHSSVPVLVVKNRPKYPYDSIACATDLYPASRLALKKAAQMFPKADFQLERISISLDHIRRS